MIRQCKICLNKLTGQKGFTLVELVMTLVILGIVSATFLPKFFQISVYQERVFFDDTLAAMRYAQKLAVATGCNIQFSIAGNSYALKRPAAIDRSQCSSTNAAHFTRDLAHPGTGAAQYTGSQSSISLTPVTLYFSALGNASSDADIAVGSNKRITVTQTTGLVYDTTP
jgi:MSHA pilin protein MshC